MQNPTASDASSGVNPSLGFNAAIVDRRVCALAADQVRPLEALSVQELKSAMAELSSAVLGAFRHQTDIVAGHVQRAAQILRLQPVSRPPHNVSVLKQSEAQRSLFRGGLAPWQVRALKSHIEASLDSSMTTAELASLVHLSKYHFSRAFRQSFAASPHAYIMRCRVERAQTMMLKTSDSLTTIAANCGLADQAHLCRLFRRLVGVPPGAWRRVQTDSPD
jgi:AraC family transcriptional regulator